MFGKITDELRRLNAIANTISGHLRKLSEASDDGSQYEALRNRLDSLEGPLQAKIGEVEGILAKAQGLKNAARAAEERARGQLERQQRITDSLDEIDEDEPRSVSDEDVAFIQEGDALRGHENSVRPLRSHMDSLAAYKFQTKR